MTTNFDLSGLRILITGANRGIGEAIAEGLARAGAIVGGLCRRPDAATELEKKLIQISGTPDGALGLTADVRVESEVRTAITAFTDYAGGIDALISNAAWMPPRTPTAEVETRMLRTVTETNLYGSFFAAKHALPPMIEGGGGRIIFLSSALGSTPNPGLFPYAASKAGVNILNEVIHKEYHEQGIRTVAIAPGLTDTPGMRESVGPDYIEKIVVGYAGANLGQPSDIVPYIAFFCDKSSATMSGSTFYVRPPAHA